MSFYVHCAGSEGKLCLDVYQKKQQLTTENTEQNYDLLTQKYIFLGLSVKITAMTTISYCESMENLVLFHID